MKLSTRLSGTMVTLVRAFGGTTGEIGSSAGVDELVRQDMLRLAVESCPSGMVMFDRSNGILLVNGETERLFGYGRDELIGRTVDHLVPGGLGSEHSPNDGPMRAHGNPLLGVRKDGTRFPVEVRSNPVAGHNGMLALAVIDDISERMHNDRLKDEFVSTVSHELRTPLTSIAGSLGLLAGGASGQMPAPTMRLLTIAHKNSERLIRLINDILDIEKMESGKIVFDLKRVDVLALIEQAIESNRGYAEGFGVRLQLDPASAPVFVRADPDRLTQVVTNLLSNAIKFSAPGAEVIVAVAQQGDSGRVTVRDHGAGIPVDFKLRIFEKFAQADAADGRQKGGTGLGLSIVKQIVTLLGGTVGFESPPDGGTRFYVDLPRWELAGDATVSRDNGPRVLICDDDATVAGAISARLAAAGFGPEIALTAHDALTQAQDGHYDAILVDLMLPDRDGISLIQHLRSLPNHQNTPIVVISADCARGRDDIRSSSLDVLDWLNKPVDAAWLVDVLRRPLARGGTPRPHILHIDDDAIVLDFVANAIGATSEMTSVRSIEDARAVLAANRIDLVVLDLVLSQSSGLELLPELRDRDGTAIPVILYSARSANGHNATQVQAALTKSHAPIESLIATLRKQLAGRQALAPQKKEVA